MANREKDQEVAMKTSGNTVLITGGGTGIGLALAQQMVKLGNQVIICGRREARLNEAKKNLPELITRVADVSNPSQREELVAWLNSDYPQLNVLVNNAGIQRVVDFTKGTDALSEVDKEVAINLLAPIHLSSMLIQCLKQHQQAAIINISSGLAFTPLAVVPVYCATKAALHSLSLSMRFQLAGSSIRVFEIAPPTVPTELSGRRNRPVDPERSMSPEAVANGIMDALEHDQYEVALGPAMGLYKQREALFEAING
jgi:uncharacterized oxidoreductase